ncbi:MAG: 3-phenylpropionate/cinnamic acid dioxygenase subunit beta [Xanthobacteraceae bacterium]
MSGPAMSNVSVLPSRLLYLDLVREVEDLFYTEADLLDGRRYEEWLDLFTDDVHYWMPMRRNVPWRDQSGDTSSEHEVGWFDDDKDTLAKRVKQLMTGIHWAEEPLSRVAHVISNVRLVEKRESLADGEAMPVSCRFFVYRNRLETETDFLVGRREDVVRRANGDLKIAKRKILIEQSVLMAKNLTVFL